MCEWERKSAFIRSVDNGKQNPLIFPNVIKAAWQHNSWYFEISKFKQFNCDSEKGRNFHRIHTRFRYMCIYLYRGWSRCLSSLIRNGMLNLSTKFYCRFQFFSFLFFSLSLFPFICQRISLYLTVTWIYFLCHKKIWNKCIRWNLCKHSNAWKCLLRFVGCISHSIVSNQH